MGMSTNVYGIKPPDDKWKKMKTIWDACETMGVKIPNEVDKFFGGEEPDDSGVLICLQGLGCCSDFRREMMEGFEIDVTKLPKNVKVIRFENSY